MADLNISSLNMNSDKYIFKKKLSLRRKSKKRLFIESALMFILSFVFLFVNYLIPNKISLLQNMPTNLNKSFLLIIDLLSNLGEIVLVIFIFISYKKFFTLKSNFVKRMGFYLYGKCERFYNPSTGSFEFISV